MSARGQTRGLWELDAVGKQARGSGGEKGLPSSPALVELQGSDQAFPLITNRQNMSRALPGPNTPRPGLHQEGIFKGQGDICQRDIRAEGKRPMPGPLPCSSLPASPRRAEWPHTTAEASHHAVGEGRVEMCTPHTSVIAVHGLGHPLLACPPGYLPAHPAARLSQAIP